MATRKSRGSTPRSRTRRKKNATTPARREEQLAEDTAAAQARDKEIDLDVDESPDAVEARREAQSGPGAPGVPHTGESTELTGNKTGQVPPTRRADALDDSAEDEDGKLVDEPGEPDRVDEALNRQPDEKHGH